MTREGTYQSLQSRALSLDVDSKQWHYLFSVNRLTLLLLDSAYQNVSYHNLEPCLIRTCCSCISVTSGCGSIFSLLHSTEAGCYLFGGVVVARSAGGCQSDNLRCCQWRACRRGYGLSVWVSLHRLKLIVIYPYISYHYHYYHCISARFYNFMLCFLILCYLRRIVALVTTVIFNIPDVK